MSQRITILFVALALSACETTGVIRTDSGPVAPVADTGVVETDTGAPGVDSGRPSTGFSYRPAGCGYDVAAPPLRSVAMGTDVFTDSTGPRNVHSSIVGPADTSFAVNWAEAPATLATNVLFGTDRAAVMAADGAGTGVSNQVGHTMNITGAGVLGAVRVHEVHVCGLTPNTSYFYKVGGPGHWSRVYEYTTSPAAGSPESRMPWTLGVSGDSRGNGDNAWAIVQQRFQSRGADLQVFSGDAVGAGLNVEEWEGEFFGARITSPTPFAVTDVLGETPLMMANGNHDVLALPYLGQFAFPQERSTGETAQGEEWYSFDYANAHFVMLNDTVASTDVLAGAQAQWLRADLTAVNRTTHPWVFVVHHRPFYTCLSTHSRDTSLLAAWQPIFEQFHVDMVLTGHNHVYERSKPIMGGMDSVAASGLNGAPTASGGNLSGVVYVVAAGVGAPLYNVETSCPFTQTARDIRNYVTIEISDRTLTYHAYDLMSDSQIDTFTVTK